MASARQQMEIGIESYNNTVMTAVEEVDNAITTYAGTLRNLDILDDVVTQSRKSLDLSLDLYKRGLSPFNNVVTAQMNTSRISELGSDSKWKRPHCPSSHSMRPSEADGMPPDM